jgi:hypothetical protein
MTLRLLRAVIPGEPSVFDVNYAVSLASAWLLFLVLTAAGGVPEGGRDARPPASTAPLAAAAILLSLPARMRLSVSETEFIVLEALLLAVSLFFALWRREKDHGFLGLAVLTCALAALTRAEMLALAPAFFVLHLLALRSGAPAAGLRSKVFLAAVFMSLLLTLPRALQILSLGSDRTANLPSNPLAVMSADWRTLHFFLDPGLTPPLFLGLSGLGLAFLLRRSRAVFLCVGAWLGLVSLFYFRHLDCLSLKLRTGLVLAPLLAGLGGWGAWRLLLGLPCSWVRPGCVFLGALILASPLPYRGFLATLYTSQQEHGFLLRAAPVLPSGAYVAHLSVEESWSGRPVPGPATNHARLLALASGRPVRIMDLSRFLADVRDGQASSQPLYYYEGVTCLTPPTPAFGEPPDPGYLHPLCRAMRERFRLTPLERAKVAGESLSPESIRPGGGLIGLYRVEGARLRERALEAVESERDALAARRLTTPGSFVVAAGIVAGRRLKLSGSGALRFASRLERFGRGRGDAAAIGVFLARAGEAAGAARHLRRAAAMEPSAPLLLMAGRASLQAGDRQGAAEALSAAAALPLEAGDEARLAVLYQDLGERAKALAVLDRVIAAHPGRARFLNDRAVLYALLGRGPSAWRDANAAVEADPEYAPALLTLSSLAGTR